MVGDCSVRRLSAAGIVLGGLLLLVSPVAVGDPLVTGVVASDSLVSDADTSGLFTVTVDFDVAMNTSTSPTLIFAPDVSSTLVLLPLPLPGGSWADSDTYIATYSVSDANADVDSVTIDVTGAWDLAGEPQRDYTPVHEFEIDTRNPSAPVVAGIATDAGSSSADAVTNDSTLILSGTAESQSSVRLYRDGSSMGGPVVALGTGTWTFDYRGTVLPDGTYRFTATATDVAGNVSPESAPLTVLVDTQGAPAPEGRTPPDGTRTNDTTPTFSWTAVAADPGGGGVRDYGYSVLGPTPKSGTTTGTTYTPSPGSPLGDGNYTWKLRTRDVAGNLGAYGSSWSLVIDTVSPTVTIAASDVAIYDGDVGVGRFTVTATFSEAMSPAVLPALTLTPNPATTFTNSSGEWSVGNTEYTWTYDVVDVGVSVPDVDVTVAGGRDVAGNLQILSTNTDYVDIDTRNPELVPGASAVAVDTDPVYEGDLTQRVTLTFDEAMMTDGSVNPTITFDRGTWDTNGDGVWNSPTDTVWMETFTLVDNDEEFYERTTGVSVVAVTASNARDAAGNLQEPYAAEPEFDIDTLQPEIAEFTSIPDGGCHVAGDTVHVTVRFSESVFGALTLHLNSGGIVDVLGVTSSDSETRTYTIQWGEDSRDLDVESAVVDAGGGLVDWAGNRARWTGKETSLSLPAGHNLADNGAVIVDTTLPIAVTDPNEDETRGGADSDIVEVRLDAQGRYRLIVRQDTPVYIDVLANDIELPCLRPLSIYDFPVLPTYGTLPDENPANPVRYAPYAGYIGPDEFTYRAVDACGNVSVEATVYVEVIPQLAFADVYVTACVGVLVEIAAVATDLFLPPGAPEDAEFAFEIVEGPEHGIVAGDPAEVETTGPGGSTLAIESATVKLTYAPASGFVGRDQFRVRVSDPFGMATTAVIDIEVQACPWVGESPLVIPQGALLPLIVPVSFFANVYETAWDTVTLTGEGGTEHPEAVLATWSESLGRPTLVVDTGPLTLGAYELVVPLGNGETVTLRFVVGETP
jgi:hypothetical protein